MGLMDWIFPWRTSPTFELADDDIVVFVVGPSGAGKSLFVQEVTTRNDLVTVGASLQPCTTKVQAVRCELTSDAKTTLGVTQRNIVFVDTLSFHTGWNKAQAEKKMNKWLEKSKSRSTLVGTIYMHRVEDDLPRGHIQNHLDAFASTFPSNFVTFPRTVRGILSTQDRIGQDRIPPRIENFQMQLNSLHSRLGNTWVTSFHSDFFKEGASDVAWKAVAELVAEARRSEGLASHS